MNAYLTQQQKQQAHGLIDCLPPEKLSAVLNLLEVLVDPFDRALASADIDDEPVTEEDHRDIEASRLWFSQNKGTSFDQAVVDLGLTIEAVTNFKDAK